MSETDCCIALALVLALQKKNNKNRKKRVWMKDWLKKRCEFTHEHMLNEIRLTSPKDFNNYLRMNESIYEELLQLISPKIYKRDTHLRDAISVNQRLSITLRFLATGNTFADLKFSSAI